MRDFLFNLPWGTQMGLIFGGTIALFVAFVALHDLIVWLWNRRRTRLAIARREVRS